MADAARDTRLHDVCAPWYGERGRDFERRFWPAFTNGLRGKTDDYCSLNDHAAGRDPGGRPPSTAAQIAAAAGHINPVNAHLGNADAQRKSASAFDNRSSILIAKMRTHCPSAAVESAIDEMLFKHENELEGRVVLTPNYPANWHVVALQGQPLQGPELAEFQNNGNSLARHVLAMVQRMGKPKTTPLGMINEETTWSLIKLEDVGMSKETPTKLKSHLDSINRTRVVKKSDEDKRIKFLSLLVQPPAIFARATAELQSCCAEWQTGGMPDYSKTVEGMQELWDTFYPASGMRDRPAPRFPSETSNRVDGLNLETVTHATPPPSSRRTGAHMDALALEMPDGSIAGSAELDAYVDAMLAAAEGEGSVEGEPLCWCCLGFGHTKNKNGVNNCPSSRRFRSIASAVNVLSTKNTGIMRGRGRPAARGRG